MRAANSGAGEQKSFLITWGSPEGFLGELPESGMQFDRGIFRLILSVQVSHPLNKPHLLRKGKGIIRKTVA